MSETVFLNGEFLAPGEAFVSVEDRGFLFADGVYEVTPAYGGRFFRLPRHLDRLRRGLAALEIDHSTDDLPEIHTELLRRNGLDSVPAAIVYFQVTRGAAPRTHHFPPERVSPTVYAYAKEYVRPSRERWEEGWEAVTVPDQRWARADLKTIALLPNVLAQEAARKAGVADAVLVRDGLALEGAHNNLFAVLGDRLVTHPASNQILHGITREFVLELARGEGMRVEERPLSLAELGEASEVFFTGTTTEIRPTVRIDGEAVGEGAVGPVTRSLFDLFLEGVGRECRAAVPGGTGSSPDRAGTPP